MRDDWITSPTSAHCPVTPVSTALISVLFISCSSFCHKLFMITHTTKLQSRDRLPVSLCNFQVIQPIDLCTILIPRSTAAIPLFQLEVYQKFDRHLRYSPLVGVYNKSPSSYTIAHLVCIARVHTITTHHFFVHLPKFWSSQHICHVSLPNLWLYSGRDRVTLALSLTQRPYRHTSINLKLLAWSSV